MKTIKINHIAKTEGHMSFVGALIGDNFAQARIETEEGSRLIEGILLGRKYYEAPIITARICGICPIVHNLTSIKALEQALNVDVTPEILVLRKILINAQWIHSHGLHVFFLSFPDLVGISNNINLLQKYPAESKLALELRDFGVEISRIIGGRTVHPINSVVGGFNVEPDFIELNNQMEKIDEMLSKAEKLASFVMKQKLPLFARPTNYVSLANKKEYAIYDGKVKFFDSKKEITAGQFSYEIEEHILPHERVKRVRHNERVMMLGALARFNNGFDQLNSRAKASWNKINVHLPSYNPFYNIFAQAVEIIHSIEEIKKLFVQYERMQRQKNFAKQLKVAFKPNPGTGYAVMEAPRGILYHQYELDKFGTLTYVNIIPPTTIFLNNMEKDLEEFLLQIRNEEPKKRDALIKTLIRAYDPCISCATH